VRIDPQWSVRVTLTGVPAPARSITMYDMYPDWGPAAHHPENPRSIENTQAALQAAIDLRDNGGMRPDDN
jgi:hypothetical protein